MWKPLNTAVAGRAHHVLAGSFAEKCSPCDLSWTLRECWLEGWSPDTYPLPAASEGRSTAASEVAQEGLAGNYVSWN